MELDLDLFELAKRADRLEWIKDICGEHDDSFGKGWRYPISEIADEFSRMDMINAKNTGFVGLQALVRFGSCDYYLAARHIVQKAKHKNISTTNKQKSD